MTDNSVASCPNCSKKLNVPSSAIGKKARCKGCQHVFQLEENVFQETTSASSSIKQCFSCGKNVLPPSVTCSHCGASLESGTRPQIEQQPSGEWASEEELEADRLLWSASIDKRWPTYKALESKWNDLEDRINELKITITAMEIT